ncbi:MAG: endonuclease V [Thermoplasmata archaeon]
MRFKEEAWKILSQIPEGRIATYGEVARALGDVRASRAIFNLLEESHQEHRVVNLEGRASPWQIEPLEKDGVTVEGGRVLEMNDILFKDFQTTYPLRRLREEQEDIAKEVVLENGFEKVERVCGFDLGYEDNRAICAFAVVDTESLEIIEKGAAIKETDFPYIPGYLAYREYPAINVAYKRLRTDVDVLLVDGHGLLHPRRAGIACHVGVKLETPTIGVAKNLLLGSVRRPPGMGGIERVHDKGEMLGYALRSSISRSPIYVSPGHLVSFESSVQIVKNLCRTRIPEPLRVAHGIASSERQG